MTTKLENAKRKRAELDAKIARDELREKGRGLAYDIGRALTRRDYGNLGELVQQLDETCCAITDSIIAVAESAEEAE